MKEDNEFTIDQYSNIIHCTAFVMNKIKHTSNQWERMNDQQKSFYSNYDEYVEVKVREAIQEYLVKKGA